MKFLSKLNTQNQKGFTLVELMIVVAIIGVLSAIAIPNFKKYQAKSKTTEAKIQLAAAYTAQVSFNSEYDTYHTCLGFMGFNPENEKAQRYYLIGFQDSIDTTSVDAIRDENGAGGCLSDSGTANHHFFDAGKKLGSNAPAERDSAEDYNASPAFALSSVSETSFVVSAVGVIDANYNDKDLASGFTINESKIIRQITPGY